LVELCEMQVGEELAVLDLVMRGFDRFVRSDFSAQGVDEFSSAAESFVVGHAPGHRVTLLRQDGALVGMVDVRDDSHISLFFVDPDTIGRGLGRTLLASVEARSREAGIRALSVNSSPWAVPVYERLGFLATAPEAEVNGIRFVAMTKEL